MTNCLFYAMFFTLFLNVSFGSLRYSQINRAFTSIYKGMVEACVETIDIHGDDVTPFYNKVRIEKYTNDYFSKEIGKYTKEYTLEIDYFNKDTGQLCNENCNQIKMKLSAKINIFYNYENTQVFSIRSRDEL